MGYIVQQQGGRRASRYASRRNADINMTNLMDVMMVLLVVFMVAAPLMTSGIALDLPKVGGKALSGDDTSVNISVDKDRGSGGRNRRQAAGHSRAECRTDGYDFGRYRRRIRPGYRFDGSAERSRF